MYENKYLHSFTLILCVKWEYWKFCVIVKFLEKCISITLTKLLEDTIGYIYCNFYIVGKSNKVSKSTMIAAYTSFVINLRQ